MSRKVTLKVKIFFPVPLNHSIAKSIYNIINKEALKVLPFSTVQISAFHDGSVDTYNNLFEFSKADSKQLYDLFHTQLSFEDLNYYYSCSIDCRVTSKEHIKVSISGYSDTVYSIRSAIDSSLKSFVKACMSINPQSKVNNSATPSANRKEESTAMSSEKKICFVICPISEEGSETRKRSDILLNYIIQPALPENYIVKRSDLDYTPDKIDEKIIEYLRSADLAIADLTDHNPNVFYEVGYRSALDLPLILISQKGTTRPFDVSTYRTFTYGTEVTEVEKAVSDLKKAIASTKKFPDGFVHVANGLGYRAIE